MNKNNLFIGFSGTPLIDETKVEIVERKGIGHPDSLCDAIAEKISRAYSRYTLDNFGVILRHMVDKIAISGGSAKVSFGGGHMTSPIRVYLNCRFTRSFSDKEIPYLQIASEVIRKHFVEVLPLLDLDKWLIIVDNTHFTPGPGVVYEKDGRTYNEREFFFDVPDEKMALHHSNSNRSNDTSTAVGYYPLSKTEALTVAIEEMLNSRNFKSENPYVGTDIKVMTKRVGKILEITACIPFISEHTPDYGFYAKKLKKLRELIVTMAKESYPDHKITVFLNTRDNPDRSDYYITLTGSAIESGDEGVVGRGNRYNGVIPFYRRMSMEACCGKNPVYHVGKVYTALCLSISKEIFDQTGIQSYVYLTSQMGRDLNDPWLAHVEVCGSEPSGDQVSLIERIIDRKLSEIPRLTEDIVSGSILLF